MWLISIKVGVKAKVEQIHFNLFGHGFAQIHTDSLNVFRLRRMGTCAISNASKLKTNDLMRISQTEIPWPPCPFAEGNELFFLNPCLSVFICVPKK